MMAPLWKLLSMATLSVPAVAEVLHVQQPLEALPFRQLTSQHFEPSVGEFSDTSTLTVYYGPKNNVTVRLVQCLLLSSMHNGVAIDVIHVAGKVVSNEIIGRN